MKGLDEIRNKDDAARLLQKWSDAKADRRQWEACIDTYFPQANTAQAHAAKAARCLDLAWAIRSAVTRPEQFSGVDGQILAAFAWQTLTGRLLPAEAPDSIRAIIDELFRDLLIFAHRPNAPEPKDNQSLLNRIDLAIEEVASSSPVEVDQLDLVLALARLRRFLYRADTERGRSLLLQQTKAFQRAVQGRDNDLWDGARNATTFPLLLAWLLTAWEESGGKYWTGGPEVSLNALVEKIERQMGPAQLDAKAAAALLRYWACRQPIWEHLLRCLVGFAFTQPPELQPPSATHSPYGDEVNILVIGSQKAGKSSLAFALEELNLISIQQHPALYGYNQQPNGEWAKRHAERKAIWRTGVKEQSADFSRWKTSFREMFAQSLPAKNHMLRACFHDVGGEELENLSLELKTFIKLLDAKLIVAVLDGGRRDKWVTSFELIRAIINQMSRDNGAADGVRLVLLINKVDLRVPPLQQPTPSEYAAREQAIRWLTSAKPFPVIQSLLDQQAHETWRQLDDEPLEKSIVREDLTLLGKLLSQEPLPRGAWIALAYVQACPGVHDPMSSIAHWEQGVGAGLKTLWSEHILSWLVQSTGADRRKRRSAAFLLAFNERKKRLEVFEQQVALLRQDFDVGFPGTPVQPKPFWSEDAWQDHFNALAAFTDKIKTARDELRRTVVNRRNLTQKVLLELRQLLGLKDDLQDSDREDWRRRGFTDPGEPNRRELKMVAEFLKDDSWPACHPIAGAIRTFRPWYDADRDFSGYSVKKRFEECVSKEEIDKALNLTLCDPACVTDSGFWSHLAFPRNSVAFREWHVRHNYHSDIDPLLQKDQLGCLRQWIHLYRDVMDLDQGWDAFLLKLDERAARLGWTYFYQHMTAMGFNVDELLTGDNAHTALSALKNWNEASAFMKQKEKAGTAALDLLKQIVVGNPTQLKLDVWYDRLQTAISWWQETAKLLPGLQKADAGNIPDILAELTPKRLSNKWDEHLRYANESYLQAFHKVRAGFWNVFYTSFQLGPVQITPNVGATPREALEISFKDMDRMSQGLDQG